MKVDQTMKVLSVLVVLLICWVSTVEPQVPRTRTVTFNVAKAGYNKFIEDFRNKLLDGAQQPNGTKIPKTMKVLASPSVLPFNNTNRYIVVKLIAFSSSVELGIDVTDVYVLGYRTQIENRSYFLNEVNKTARDILFQGSNKTDLNFSGNYISIEKKSGSRDQIPLGFQQLIDQVKKLDKSTNKEADIAKALIVCIQMVSEAARYKYIQDAFANLGTNGSLKPNRTMTGHQNNWGKLSEAVQKAHDNGTFKTNITVTPGLIYRNVSSVTGVISLLKWYNTTGVFATAPLGELNEEALD